MRYLPRSLCRHRSATRKLGSHQGAKPQSPYSAQLKRLNCVPRQLFHAAKQSKRHSPTPYDTTNTTFHKNCSTETCRSKFSSTVKQTLQRHLRQTSVLSVTAESGRERTSQNNAPLFSLLAWRLSALNPACGMGEMPSTLSSPRRGGVERARALRDVFCTSRHS